MDVLIDGWRELVEVWRAWQDGKLPNEALLWNRPVYFWERVGMSVQFFAAMLILAEIAGPANIRRFGRSLDATRLLRRLLRRGYTLAGSMVAALGRALGSPPGSSGASTPAPAFTAGGAVAVQNTLAAALLVFWSGVAMYFTMLNAGESPRVSFVWSFAATGLLVVVLLFVAVLLLVLATTGFGLLLDWILFRPSAWLLDRPYVDKLFKVASLVILAIGFHFSLLAS